jgi:hypothetical protein
MTQLNATSAGRSAGNSNSPARTRGAESGDSVRGLWRRFLRALREALAVMAA